MAETHKTVLDFASFGIVVGTWFEHLPKIAAGLAIIWTTIRIVEWTVLTSIKLYKLLTKKGETNGYRSVGPHDPLG